MFDPCVSYIKRSPFRRHADVPSTVWTHRIGGHWNPSCTPRYPQLPISYRPSPSSPSYKNTYWPFFLYKITQTPSTPKGRFFLWCCAYITIASHTDDPTAYFHSPSLVICFLLHLLHSALPFVHSIQLYTTPTALHHTQDKRSPSHCADVLHLDTPSLLPSRSIN